MNGAGTAWLGGHRSCLRHRWAPRAVAEPHVSCVGLLGLLGWGWMEFCFTHGAFLRPGVRPDPPKP